MENPTEGKKKYCKYCGAVMPAGATECPICHQKQRMNFLGRLAILVVIVIVIFLIIFFILYFR